MIREGGGAAFSGAAGLLREFRLRPPADPHEDAEIRQRTLRELWPINLGMQIYGGLSLGLTHWLTSQELESTAVLSPVYSLLLLSLAITLLWRDWTGLCVGRFLCFVAVAVGLRISILQTGNPYFWPIPVALVMGLTTAIAYDNVGEYTVSHLFCWGVLCGWGLVDNGHPEQAARIVLLMASGIALGIAVNVLLTLTRRRAHRLNLHLARMAHRDFLTGIRNRRSFLEAVEDDLRQRPLVHRYCLMLDVDNFKKINDDFGHAVGDGVLVDIAHAIRRVSGDQHHGRLGGEEFGIVVAGLQYDEVRAFAARVVAEVGMMSVCGRPLSVSIGLARCAAGIALAQTMQRADRALYEAKSAGKNCYVAEAPPLGLVV